MIRDLKRFPRHRWNRPRTIRARASSPARRRARVLFESWKPSRDAEPGGKPGTAAARAELPAGDSSVILPVLRWPEPGAWRWRRPATAAASAGRWTPPCACARAIARTAVRRRRPGPRPTWSGRSPPGRSIPSSGGARNSRPMPAFASIASSASPSARRASMSRA